MANIHPEIKPSGVEDKYLVDLMYMLQRSLQLICTKLDAESAGLNTYLANCYTALMTVRVTDYRGNMTTGESVVDFVVTPVGLSTEALLLWIYEWINAFETLVEQLDGDAAVCDDTDYEDLCYEALITPYQFESGRYDQTTILGNDVTTGGFDGSEDGAPWLTTKIGPVGRPNDRVLADLFYDILNGWETMCEKLDADAVAAPPTDTDYEALCYEATVLMRVENSQGNVLGNSQTRLG